MTAAAMIRDFADAGIRLSRNGSRLHVEAKAGAVTDDMRRLLTEHKDDLLAALNVDPDTDPRSRVEEHREVIEEAYAALRRTLADDPSCKRAVRTVDTGDDAKPVLVAVAIRGKGFVTLAIERGRYDGFELLRILDSAQANERREPSP